MSMLSKEGFLAAEAERVIEEVGKKYAGWAKVLRDINREAVAAQHRIEIQNGDVQGLLVACLYARTLSNVQGAVLMTERGMDVQARILLRAAMESLFSMVAIIKTPGVTEQFIAADAVFQKKMFQKARAWKSPELRKISEDSTTDEKLAELKKAVEEKDAKELKAEWLAQQAGLHDWYLTAYAVLSASVHSSVRDLERHIVTNAEGEVEELRNEPDLSNLGRLWLMASELLLKALDTLANQFGFDYREFYKAKYEELAALAKGEEG